MSLLGALKRLVVPTTPQQQGYEWTRYEEVPCPRGGRCPNCRGQSFYQGPEGGLSMNVECAQCGCRWNANAVGMNWQYIGRNDEFRAMVRRARAKSGIVDG